MFLTEQASLAGDALGLLTALIFVYFIGKFILFELLGIDVQHPETKEWQKGQSLGNWLIENFFSNKKDE